MFGNQLWKWAVGFGIFILLALMIVILCSCSSDPALVHKETGDKPAATSTAGPATVQERGDNQLASELKVAIGDLHAADAKIETRVCNVETKLTNIEGSLVKLNETATETNRAVLSLGQHTYQGTFAGSGVYAFAALVVVLVGIAAFIVLVLRYHRLVIQSNGGTPALPAAKVVTSP